MKRVTGIGGIFIKSADPQRMRDWYKKHLGIQIDDWGGTSFEWTNAENPKGIGSTVWSIFEASSAYFDPSKATFMVNYRVDKLAPLLEALRAEGCNVADKSDDSEYGKFGWVFDPDGNKIELWEPPPGK
jgi:catechol 2,3-dioxygenase-like lactoylglutathione lyase family enzyme